MKMTEEGFPQQLLSCLLLCFFVVFFLSSGASSHLPFSSSKCTQSSHYASWGSEATRTRKIAFVAVFLCVVVCMSALDVFFKNRNTSVSQQLMTNKRQKKVRFVLLSRITLHSRKTSPRNQMQLCCYLQHNVFITKNKVWETQTPDISICK